MMKSDLEMLSHCHSILDLRARAQRRLPSPIFHFLDGGAETETTLRRNTAAFDDLPLIPKCLVDVTSVRTTTRVLGQELQWPVFCAPTGASRLFHPEGELAVARAAAKTGTLYSLANGSTHSLEEVAAVSAGPKLFQVYLFKDRDRTWQLIERCKLSGYNVLCLTVDTPVSGKRERDLHSGFSVPPRLTLKSLAGFARRPAWLARQLLRGSAFEMANFVEARSRSSFLAQSKRFAGQLDASITWKDVRELTDRWSGPFALKGVMSADAARRAADVGVTAIVVSNHGGRQLDGAAAAIEVLPEIVHAVGEQIEVILDGGIRRGVHVLKALALGAKACSIGRPYLYGLSAGGEEGVIRALDILRTELVLAMKLTGCPDLDSIDRSLLGRFHERTAAAWVSGWPHMPRDAETAARW